MLNYKEIDLIIVTLNLKRYLVDNLLLIIVVTVFRENKNIT